MQTKHEFNNYTVTLSDEGAGSVTVTPASALFSIEMSAATPLGTVFTLAMEEEEHNKEYIEGICGLLALMMNTFPDAAFFTDFLRSFNAAIDRYNASVTAGKAEKTDEGHLDDLTHAVELEAELERLDREVKTMEDGLRKAQNAIPPA